MSTYLQVSTTASSREDAERIAKEVVNSKLAACAQIVGPIESVYRWKGGVERKTEWLCLIKTTEAAYREVERAVFEMHPYETPEIVAVPIVTGSAAYLAWLREQVAV